MSQFDDLIQNSRDTAAAAKERLQAGYGKAKAATTDAAEKGRAQAARIGEKISPAIARGKTEATRANSKLKQAADEQPLTLVAGAIAMGALLGSLLPKRNKPKE